MSKNKMEVMKITQVYVNEMEGHEQNKLLEPPVQFITGYVFCYVNTIKV